MNREQLKALGLSDEVIDQVMALHGTAMGKLTGQVETLTSERDSLQATADQYASQVKDLKAEADKVPGMAEKLAEMEKTQSESIAASEKIKKDYEIKIALQNSGAKSTVAVRKMLDDSKIAIDDDGNVIGINEQLEELKASEEFGFLFQEQTPPAADPVNPSKPQITFAQNSNADLSNPGEIDPFELARQKYQKRG